MLAPVTHILPVTNIQRTRSLPVAGRVIVRKGQKVNPTDTLAEGNLKPQHVLLDVGRGLGMSPEKADRYIQRKVGDEVAEGDVIAEHGWRVMRTSQAGKVVASGHGQVLLEIEIAPFELKAGLSGTVVELLPDHGAILEATGALIQGVWGNGHINFGLLNPQIQEPGDEIPATLDVSLRGSVVLAGYCGQASVLEAANELPLRGLILSSMPSTLIPVALEAQYPIILLEGFGRIPINQPAFKLLTSSSRREVALNAEPWDRFTGQRPEITIALSTEASTSFPAETADFAPGKIVRAVRAPYKGKTGSLVTLLPGLTHLPNGLRVQAAEIRFETGENGVVPLANLEILE
jgi:hypothetical protein